MHPGKSWIFFLENSRTWKVQENHSVPGKSWKLELKILESCGKISLKVVHFSTGSMMVCVDVEKKQECLVRGRTSEELTDQFGFTVENSAAMVQSMCTAGFTTHDSDYNALGYSSMGVYLCRHADVCLSHAVVKFSGSPVIRLIICKVPYDLSS